LELIFVYDLNMTFRNSEKEKRKKLYLVSSANWESVVKSESEVEAATKAVNEIYNEDLEMKISPTIMVTNLSAFSKSDQNIDICSFCYSPKILSNAGLHDLSKDLDQIINQIQNES
jgi:hypothetical protein